MQTCSNGLRKGSTAMSHSLTKIWIHTTFSTKGRTTSIQPAFEMELLQHIKEHLEQDFDCPVRAINRTTDHIHILFLLNPNHAVKDILKNVKGESSHWVNQGDFSKFKFAWQTGYAAFSVSEFGVPTVAEYIRNQKEHHRRKTFAEEYEELVRKHGLTWEPETVETVFEGG